MKFRVARSAAKRIACCCAEGTDRLRFIGSVWSKRLASLEVGGNPIGSRTQQPLIRVLANRSPASPFQPA